ncbi:MAG: DUF1343 domain-containing protein [Lentisphaeria bacterium]|nr:DUF1343 domain-containing protein [Candidatus Neomarinimicrobiota bacterium]MCF7841358.1 DUF1343 domain-containing protein [Lentisphaeria bacterium]
MQRFVLSISAFIILAGCSAFRPEITVITPVPEIVKVSEEIPVRTGLEIFLASAHDSTVRYGLMTNQTGVDAALNSNIVLLDEVVNLVALYSPEHGIYGAEFAGDKVGQEIDPQTGIPAYSTYRKKPADIAPILDGIDVLIIDIQDIGVRGYTYIYSMAYMMEAAQIAGKRVLVFDRPNPITGSTVEGNILDPAVASFVGLYPIPYRYGMTIGELAYLFNEEFGLRCELEIIRMAGWQREMWFDETGLPWIPTSPHVPHAETVLNMIATGVYGELGVLSEGVGTTLPFEYVGGPWIKDPHRFAAILQERIGPGVKLRPCFFKPYYGRHTGQICGGVQLYVTDRNAYRPYLTGFIILATAQELYPEVDLFGNENRWGMFDKVSGGTWIREAIQNGDDPHSLEARWQADLEKFMTLRQKYLLY